MEGMEHSDGHNHWYRSAVEDEGYYVVSEDVVSLLAQWAAPRGFVLPPAHFFVSLRNEMRRKLEGFFPRVMLVSEEGLRRAFRECLGDMPPRALVSADYVYAPQGCLHLEISRLTAENMESEGQGSRNSLPVARQLEVLRSTAEEPVTLVDDVLFSGESACGLIRMVRARQIEVAQIFAGISTRGAVQRIRAKYPKIGIYSVLYFPNGVLDEVCERDFYAGVPFSGRVVGRGGIALAPEQGLPYFQPFIDKAHVREWSSVPLKHVEEWSHFCCSQSIALWTAIEKCSGKEVRCSDLSRRPNLVPCDDSRFVDRLHELAFAEA